jgi:hypothetical protein
MRRVVGFTLIAAAAAAAGYSLRQRRPAIASSGNGHAADEARIEMLRDRIAAARRRLRDEIDSVRGE